MRLPMSEYPETVARLRAEHGDDRHTLRMSRETWEGPAQMARQPSGRPVVQQSFGLRTYPDESVPAGFFDVVEVSR